MMKQVGRSVLASIKEQAVKETKKRKGDAEQPDEGDSLLATILTNAQNVLQKQEFEGKQLHDACTGQCEFDCNAQLVGGGHQLMCVRSCTTDKKYLSRDRWTTMRRKTNFRLAVEE